MRPGTLTEGYPKGVGFGRFEDSQEWESDTLLQIGRG